MGFGLGWENLGLPLLLGFTTSADREDQLNAKVHDGLSERRPTPNGR